MVDDFYGEGTFDKVSSKIWAISSKEFARKEEHEHRYSRTSKKCAKESFKEAMTWRLGHIEKLREFNYESMK